MANLTEKLRAEMDTETRTVEDAQKALCERVLKVHLTFIENVLGTASNDEQIHETYIASKALEAPNRAQKIAEEIAAVGVDEVTEQGRTIFPKTAEGYPIFWDYQIKGFFKDTCGALQRCKGADCAKQSVGLKAYKKIIDGCIFAFPRQIPIDLHGMMISDCQRPLRAQTAQGERVAIADSESIPAGSTIDFEIGLLSKSHEKAVMEWLNYGVVKGMGQWRNSGKGRFVCTVEVIK